MSAIDLRGSPFVGRVFGAVAVLKPRVLACFVIGTAPRLPLSKIACLRSIDDTPCEENISPFSGICVRVVTVALILAF